MLLLAFPRSVGIIYIHRRRRSWSRNVYSWAAWLTRDTARTRNDNEYVYDISIDDSVNGDLLHRWNVTLLRINAYFVKRSWIDFIWLVTETGVYLLQNKIWNYFPNCTYTELSANFVINRNSNFVRVGVLIKRGRTIFFENSMDFSNRWEAKMNVYFDRRKRTFYTLWANIYHRWVFIVIERWRTVTSVRMKRENWLALFSKGDIKGETILSSPRSTCYPRVCPRTSCHGDNRWSRSVCQRTSHRLWVIVISNCCQ